MRSKAALLLSLVLGVVAVVLLFSWASGLRRQLLEESNMVGLLVDDRVRWNVPRRDEQAHHVGFFQELTPQPAGPREQQDDGNDAQDE